MPAEIGELASLDFSPDGHYLAVRYFGGAGWGSIWNQAIHGRTGVRLYDTATRRFAVIPDFYHSILSPPGVVFSPDGRSLALWSEGHVGVYDLPFRSPWLAIAAWALMPMELIWLFGRWRAARGRKQLIADSRRPADGKSRI